MRGDNSRILRLNQAKHLGYHEEGDKWAIGNFHLDESFILTTDRKVGGASGNVPGFNVPDVFWMRRARFAALLTLSLEATTVRRRLHGSYVGSALEHFLACGLPPR